MAPVKRARAVSKSKPRKRSSTTTKKKKAGPTRSYTVLRKSTLDSKKKVSTQGKPATTTKTGAYLAARVALKRRTRPTRIYLYRKKKITTYSIKYGKRKDGKVKAVAKLVRTVTVKRKKPSSKKKTTKKKRKTSAKKRKTTKKKRKTSTKKKRKTSTNSEIAKLRRQLAKLIC